MLTDVRIWLYELNKCGYYKFRGNTPPEFGGTSQTLDALASWANLKQLGQTSTFSVEDENGGAIGGAYFLDAARGPHGDYMVGLWNRLPGNRNNVSSVGIGDVVGSVSAEVTEIDRNRIPGFATYFWVMPSANRLACIRVKHDAHGLENFKKYLRGFLKYYNPQNVVLDTPGANGELVVKGYRKDTTSNNTVNGICPKLSVKSIDLTGDIAYLRNNASAIDKVLSKTTLSAESPGDWQRWQKVLELSRFVRKPPPLREEALIKLEFPMQFTASQLDDAIKEWQEREDNNDATAQDDLGFHLRTGETKWLSKSQPRTGYQMAVTWIDEELVDVELLLQQLQVHRTAVLALG